MKTIAIVNEKGGTGKTTTAVNLAAALGRMGQKVLLVDLDGQAASSRWLGVEDDSRLADAILKGGGLEPLENVIPGVSLAPASGKLDSVSHDLRPTQGGQLRKVLAEVADDYDFVLIDCPPSLGNRLIGNGLLAATHAIVPVEMSILALDGLKILLTTLDDIRDGFDHKIDLIGILACRYEPRTRLSRLILSELQNALGDKVFETVVRETVRMQECPASGESILEYAPRSHAAEDYRALAEELVAGSRGLIADCETPEGNLATEPELTESERLAVVDFRKQAYEGLIRNSRKSDRSARRAATAEPAEGDAQPTVEQADESAPAAPETAPDSATLADSPAADSPACVDSVQQEEEKFTESSPSEPDQVEVLCRVNTDSEDQAEDAAEDLPHLPQVAEMPEAEEQQFSEDSEEPPAAEEAPFTPDDFASTRFDDWQGTVLLSESRRRNGKKRAVLASTTVAVMIVASVLVARWGLNRAGLAPQSASADDTELRLVSPAVPDEEPCEARQVDADATDAGDLHDDAEQADAGTEAKTPAPADGPEASDSSRDPIHAPPADQPDSPADASEPEPNPPREPDAEAIADAAAPAETDDTADQPKPADRYRTPPPGFSVTGIMSSSTGAGAIVNGQWVQVGHTVDGATVTGIAPSAVELELDGEKFRLGLGETSANDAVPAEESTGDSGESTSEKTASAD